jgi:hypothetical protein
LTNVVDEVSKATLQTVLLDAVMDRTHLSLSSVPVSHTNISLLRYMLMLWVGSHGHVVPQDEMIVGLKLKVAALLASSSLPWWVAFTVPSLA